MGIRASTGLDDALRARPAMAEARGQRLVSRDSDAGGELETR